MAYVVARRDGRFEIRESEQTGKGPRARTLASFRVLSDEVLAHAKGKAQRPFDTEAVLTCARRAGVPVEFLATRVRSTRSTRDGRAAIGAFLAASRRMANATSQPGPRNSPASPGAVLLELLGFADAVKRSQPPRSASALAFPVLARFAAERRAALRSGAPLAATSH